MSPRSKHRAAISLSHELSEAFALVSGAMKLIDEVRREIGVRGEQSMADTLRAAASMLSAHRDRVRLLRLAPCAPRAP